MSQLRTYLPRRYRLAPGEKAIEIYHEGDTHPRFTLDSDGNMTWGPGNAAADVSFERIDEEILGIAGELHVDALKIGGLNGILKAATGAVSGSATTTDLPEGAGLYYTDSRVDDRITGTWRGLTNGLASLDSGGKVPSSQLPAIAITVPHVVGSQAAMLALDAQTGDVAIRTDINKSFVLDGDPTTLANWKELLTPTAPVQSVNGQTGSVDLSTTDIAEGSNLYYTDTRVDSRISGTWRGAANGLASLDAATKIPVAQLPTHTHAAADITSGQLALARGGTGANLSAEEDGVILYKSGTAFIALARNATSTRKYLSQIDGDPPTWEAVTGDGTVTSVGLSLPSIFSVSGSPVTTSGTLTGSLATQAANRVFAGPSSGGDATPTVRSLVALDIPSIDTSKITTGQFALARGGTGADLSSAGVNSLLYVASGPVLTTLAPTDGYLRRNGAAPHWHQITGWAEPSYFTPTRTFDPTSSDLDTVRQYLATLVSDLRAGKILTL